MNKYQKALNRVRESLKESDETSVLSDIEILKELVDKSTLQYAGVEEVKGTYFDSVKPFCPKCEAILSWGGNRIRYCWKCGQKVKIED